MVGRLCLEKLMRHPILLSLEAPFIPLFSGVLYRESWSQRLCSTRSGQTRQWHGGRFFSHSDHVVRNIAPLPYTLTRDRECLGILWGWSASATTHADAAHFLIASHGAHRIESGEEMFATAHLLANVANIALT